MINDKDPRTKKEEDDAFLVYLLSSMGAAPILVSSRGRPTESSDALSNLYHHPLPRDTMRTVEGVPKKPRHESGLAQERNTTTHLVQRLCRVRHSGFLIGRVYQVLAAVLYLRQHVDGYSVIFLFERLL
jgi:hypothetical protein